MIIQRLTRVVHRKVRMIGKHEGREHPVPLKLSNTPSGDRTTIDRVPVCPTTNVNRYGTVYEYANMMR